MIIIFIIISCLLSQANTFLHPYPSCTATLSLGSRNNDIMESSSTSQSINRRDMLSKPVQSALLTMVTSTITSSPKISNAATPTIRITSYPSLEYLEPIYELKLSIDSLQQNIQNTSTYPYIYKRLDKMFANGIFSEKNYYLGLAVTFNNQIVYDDNELKTFINLDKEERFNLINDAFKRLESLKNNLNIMIEGNNDTLSKSGDRIKDILNDVDDAQRFITKWFDLVPKEDVNAVDTLFRMVRNADSNHDGKLDAKELANLPDKERDVWIKRIALVGD